MYTYTYVYLTYLYLWPLYYKKLKMLFLSPPKKR